MKVVYESGIIEKTIYYTRQEALDAGYTKEHYFYKNGKPKPIKILRDHIPRDLSKVQIESKADHRSYRNFFNL